MPILPIPGASLNYLREGAGPAALLLSGIGMIAEGWRPQIDGLAARYTLVAPDNRGIGASLLDTSRSISVERMAHDALTVMDAEGLSRFHLVGHAAGALIAQQVALLAPERVKSLTLLCGFVHGGQAAPVSPSLLWTTFRMWFGPRRGRRHAFLRLLLPAGYLDRHDADQVAGALAPLLGRDLADHPAVIAAQLRAMLRYDAAERWAELARIPSMVIVAARDRVSRPAYGSVLAAALRGARLVELPEAGHAAAFQCAGEINALFHGHWRAAETPDASPAAAK